MKSATDNPTTVDVKNSGGWRVASSVVIELNMAIWLIGQADDLRTLKELMEPLVATLAPELLADLPALIGSGVSGPDTPLVDLGELAGVLEETDYSRATLAMRTLTPAWALAALGETIDDATDDDRIASQLIDALTNRALALHGAIGLESGDSGGARRRFEANAERLVRILPGGDLHARFWHWLDRFYYESYGPWRGSRRAFMEAERARAAAALGGLEGDGVPELAWLPPQHPLANRASIRRAVIDGRFGVHFLLEPFGMVDLLEVDQHDVYCTFGEPGEQFAAFRDIAEEVAAGAKALGDPTRLIILRLIRNFGMDNTEMARFLEIARPTVSVHAKILREAGLIRTRQVGRQAHHEIDAAAVRQLFRDLERFLDLPPERAEQERDLK